MKCDCIATVESHQHPNGIELADPDCELCGGTGYVDGEPCYEPEPYDRKRERYL